MSAWSSRLHYQPPQSGLDLSQGWLCKQPTQIQISTCLLFAAASGNAHLSKLSSITRATRQERDAHDVFLAQAASRTQEQICASPCHCLHGALLPSVHCCVNVEVPSHLLELWLAFSRSDCKRQPGQSGTNTNINWPATNANDSFVMESKTL